jgi:hypothetical protein
MSPKTIGDTSDEATRLARGVLIEILEIAPELREKSALGGGLAVRQWVGEPPDFGPLNTADVDLVLDLAVEHLQPPLRQRILDTGKYSQGQTVEGRSQTWSFWRVSSERGRMVRLDLQGPDVGGSRSLNPRAKRQDLGGLHAFVLESGALGLNQSVSQTMAGVTPEGEAKAGTVRVVPPHLLLPMKALAFEDRGIRGEVKEEYRKTKDAADIFALWGLPGGPTKLAVDLRPWRRAFTEKAAEILEQRFMDRDGDGANALVEFLRPRIEGPDAEADLRQRLTERTEEYLRGYRRHP